jgi:DNA polymerase (family X)
MKPGTSHEEAVSGINTAIARCFDEIAELLESRSRTDFRIAPYRRGASVLRELLSSVDAIFDDSGREGLEGIPGLGRSLALSVEKFLQTGLMPTLELLRGNGLPPRFMRTPESPRRRRRVMQARHPVNVQRATIIPSAPDDPSQPSIGQLLSIDAEYREKSANDELVRIAPRQFNPTGAEWLPILHTRRNEWHYTAAFSNTAHAHEAGMTHDWVIIHRDAAGQSGHWTVITSKFGELKNRRFVRGCEDECLVFYQKHPHNVFAGEDFEQPPRPQQKLLFDME